MSRNKDVQRHAIVQMLVSAGVPKSTAWSEVGFMLNRANPEQVFSAVSIAVFKNDKPTAKARQLLGLGLQ